MGDGYNTWGGKNNSWGNRNKKGGGSSRGSSNKGSSGGSHYEPNNKLLGIVFAGAFMVALAHTGFGWVNDIIDNIGTAKDAVGTVQKVSSSTNINKESSSDTHRKADAPDKSDIKHINKAITDKTPINNYGDFPLGATDVRDIILDSEGTLQTKGDVAQIYVYTFDSVSTEEGYTDNVLEAVNNTEGTATIVITKPQNEYGDIQEMYDVLKQFIGFDNDVIDKTKHNTISTCGTSSYIMNYDIVVINYEHK